MIIRGKLGKIVGDSDQPIRHCYRMKRLIMNDEIALSAIDERLCFALYSTSQAIIKKYQKGLKSLDMTYPQYLVFLVLEPQQTLTVSELGEALFLDSGTLSPLLKRMEKAELIHRSRDIEDERRVIVGLTDKAREYKPMIAALQKEVSCSTGLAPDQFKALLLQLQQLNKRLRHLAVPSAM